MGCPLLATYLVDSNSVFDVCRMTCLLVYVEPSRKEKDSQTHYPLVLLLNLLDRQNLLRTPSILESVVDLLATITRPLSTLKVERGSQSCTSVGFGLNSSAVRLFGDTIRLCACQCYYERWFRSTTPTLHPEHPAERGIGKNFIKSVCNWWLRPHRWFTIDANRIECFRPAWYRKTVWRKCRRKSVAASCATSSSPCASPHLTIGECSGRTFQQSLALIQHLSYIPDARDVIAHELKSKAQEFGQALYSDLDELATALQESSNNTLISSVATKFSPASLI